MIDPRQKEYERKARIDTAILTLIESDTESDRVMALKVLVDEGALTLPKGMKI